MFAFLIVSLLANSNGGSVYATLSKQKKSGSLAKLTQNQHPMFTMYKNYAKRMEPNVVAELRGIPSQKNRKI